MAEKILPNKKALTLRVTSGNLTVCRLHYAADETKNPANSAGRRWLPGALAGYQNGLSDPRWLKEMEIQYGAGGGQKVFPDWQKWLRNSNIFIDGGIDLTNAKLYGSYDHGYASPACYLVHAVWPGDKRATIWEFYDEQVEVPMIAQIIKGHDAVSSKTGKKYKGNPYAGREIMKICDPEIMRDNQVMARGPNKSVAYLFRQNGVNFVPGLKGDDGTVASWLTGNLWLDPMLPGYQIHRCCKNLIWELSMLQRVAHSPHVSKYKNQPEQLVDKDNHAWDALKYWLRKFPVGTVIVPEKKQEADFDFWMKLGKKPSKLQKSYVRDFAR
jgi:hypothetical protein